MPAYHTHRWHSGSRQHPHSTSLSSRLFERSCHGINVTHFRIEIRPAYRARPIRTFRRVTYTWMSRVPLIRAPLWSRASYWHRDGSSSLRTWSRNRHRCNPDSTHATRKRKLWTYPGSTSLHLRCKHASIEINEVIGNIAIGRRCPLSPQWSVHRQRRCASLAS